MPPASSYRDLVLATFSSTLGLAGILLALLGFLLTRYDSLKGDTTIDREKIRPFRVVIGSIAGLIALSAISALGAYAWLYSFAGFTYPLWLPATLIIAIPVVAFLTVR